MTEATPNALYQVTLISPDTNVPLQVTKVMTAAELLEFAKSKIDPQPSKFWVIKIPDEGKPVLGCYAEDALGATIATLIAGGPGEIHIFKGEHVELTPEETIRSVKLGDKELARVKINRVATAAVPPPAPPAEQPKSAQ